MGATPKSGWFGAVFSSFFQTPIEPEYLPPLDEPLAQSEWLDGFNVAFVDYLDEEAIAFQINNCTELSNTMPLFQWLTGFAFSNKFRTIYIGSILQGDGKGVFLPLTSINTVRSYRLSPLTLPIGTVARAF